MHDLVKRLREEAEYFEQGIPAQGCTTRDLLTEAADLIEGWLTVKSNTLADKALIKRLALAERIVNEIADAHLDACAHGATWDAYKAMVQRVAETLMEFKINPNQKAKEPKPPQTY